MSSAYLMPATQWEVKLAKVLRWFGVLLLILGAGLGVAWATSPDPKFNVATFENEALVAKLASLDEAITLAQVQREDGRISTLLVTELKGEAIRAVDLSQATGEISENPFVVLAAASDDELRALSGLDGPQAEYLIEALLPAAPGGSRHIGIGTNFPEHAEEANSSSVFVFPKFGRATPARTTVAARDDVLLDYEVELCMRFDRAITSLEDFDAAMKGLFLCGDFTDRAKLVRMIDPDNLDSGRGFSDGKSRNDFFPSGALLVVPRDWNAFVRKERFTAAVNGAPRQDARGGEMTLDFRGLAEKALSEMEEKRFLYRGEYHNLAPSRRIDPDLTLMSGTAEGVIFTGPTQGDIIEGSARYLLSGAWLRGEEFIPSVIETFLANEFASGHFLQAGDVVEYRSTHLGTVKITVAN